MTSEAHGETSQASQASTGGNKHRTPIAPGAGAATLLSSGASFPLTPFEHIPEGQPVVYSSRPTLRRRQRDLTTSAPSAPSLTRSHDSDSEAHVPPAYQDVQHSSLNKKKRRKRKKTETTAFDPVNDSFFVDTEGWPTMDEMSSVTTEVVVQATSLLLPAHVYLSEVVPSQKKDTTSTPPSPTNSFADDIQFIDDDMMRPAIQRYFEDKEDKKIGGKTCTTCGKAGHFARMCKIKLCWTCGAKDEHESRDCPINMLCWNCGRRGHLSMGCAEPRSSRRCNICNSDQHVQNSCPLLWRTYTSLSPKEREEELEFRTSKIGLALGEGGEGFIAWEPECFCCGNAGHWGYDCPTYRGFRNREPPAFSNYHADFGRWPFNSQARNSRNHDSKDARIAGLISAIAQASSGVETTLYQEPEAFSAGRLGKERSMQRARKKERDSRPAVEYIEGDDNSDDAVDDWFSNRMKENSQGQGRGKGKGKGKHGANGRTWPKVVEDPSSLSTTTGIHKIPPTRPLTREEREEREYFNYQAMHGGRYDEAADHGVAPRGKHSRQQGDDHRDYPDRDRDRDKPSRTRDRSEHTRDSSAKSKRTPQHRGGRDRQEARGGDSQGSSSRRPSTSYSAQPVVKIVIDRAGASVEQQPRFMGHNPQNAAFRRQNYSSSLIGSENRRDGGGGWDGGRGSSSKV